MLKILQVLSHPFCMQNKQAYTPKVCRRITWAIIVYIRSFFDDIKLAEDFIKHGDYLQFPVSTLEGDPMSIKHGIKIQRHNFAPPGMGDAGTSICPSSPLLPRQAGWGGVLTWDTAINTSSWHISATTAKTPYTAVQLAPCEVGRRMPS